MGGSGSGRWGAHSKRTTVEECRSLDSRQMQREQVLGAGVYRVGRWGWWDAETREERASIGYEVDTRKGKAPRLGLSYNLPRTRESLDYAVLLEQSRSIGGSAPWWFCCPLVRQGRPCGARVRKLYLPPGARYFGCRRCYRLTYRSCQESDKRVSALRRDPGALLQMNPRDLPLGKLVLLLKAVR